MTGHRSCSSFTPQLVIGLALAAAGVLFLLGNLGYDYVHAVLRYWPVVLILLGASKVLRAHDAGAAIGGALFILAGTWLLLTNLRLVDISFWLALRTYWPVLLVAAGLSIVTRALRRGSGVRQETMDPDNDLRTVAILGATKRTSSAAALTGGEITAVMGGVQLDLTRATLAPVNGTGRREAVLDVFAMWGGIEVFVPEGWVVDGRVFPFLGGFEDKTRPVPDERAPRLIVRGMAVMGGVEVKH
jgi:predicted membrane protein